MIEQGIAMGIEQRVEQTWETPSFEEIPMITKQHVEAMERSDRDSVWIRGGMHHVLVRTIGRRTGREHKVALPFWIDSGGQRIVAASFAGSTRYPAWYLNLADRGANPMVLCRLQGRSYWSDQEIVPEPTYTILWNALCEDRAWYRDYERLAHRPIPLVRLPEVLPETSPPAR